MKITSKGQVTIPMDIREKAGLLPHTDVEFAVEGKNVVIRKARRTDSRGNQVVAALRGKGTVRMSTDQIMALTRGE